MPTADWFAKEGETVNYIGLTPKMDENGEYPAYMEKLSEIVQNISFGNAKHYFG